MRQSTRIRLFAAVMALGIFGCSWTVTAAEDGLTPVSPGTEQGTGTENGSNTDNGTDQNTGTGTGQSTGTETEQNPETETEIPAPEPPVAEKAGWLEADGYRYYFKTSKTMVTGWKTINSKIYYFRKTAEGTAPQGSMVTGFQTISGYTYYFSKAGVLQTGWKKLKSKYYYFEPTGKAGKAGRMYTGPKTINGSVYLFAEDGHALTGWQDYGENRYYLSKSTKLGTRGKAVTGWQTIGEYRYYFNEKGVMQKSCWIIMKQKYYVDENGHKLKNCVTPDGYILNAFGARVKAAKGWVKSGGKYYYYVSRKKVTGWKKISGKKYYFDENGVRQKGWLTLDGQTYYLKAGVMQTGWTTIGGKKYYFNKKGVMQVNTTIDGIEIDANGVADTRVSILLISGHGMGDPGATSVLGTKTYYEEKYTRQFATLIEEKLKDSGANIAVTMYDQNYDCYQVNRAYQANKSVIGPLPDWKAYDFILEVHFNATAESAKDLKGDGNMKGVGIYVYPDKKTVTIEKKIVAAISKTGIPIWGRGTGVFRSNLLNARTCYQNGVSYALLETAFIDDRDDMKFYNSNKEKMAEAAASAIVAYFK